MNIFLLKFVKSITVFFVLISFLFAGQALAAGTGRGQFKSQTMAVTARVQAQTQQTTPVISSKQTTTQAIPNQVAVRSLDGTSSKAFETLSVFDDEFKVIVPAQSVSAPTDIEMIKVGESMQIPWNLELASNIFQFDFRNKTAYLPGQDLQLDIKYSPKENAVYQVYFHDRNSQTWKPLPTVDYPAENRIKASIKLSFARVAVLANTGIMTKGKASWYAYKGCDCGASPDFPKGSILRVTAVESGKFVDITVNDWGPERTKHPERVIDLDKVAFTKLAPTGAGVINVKVEPLRIAPDNSGRVLGVKVSGATTQPVVAARSAYVIDQDNNVLFEKNSEERLSIASLSKTIAVRVFLDTNPNLFKTVEYKKQDENYNYLYVKPWEAAKVSLQEGDTLLIKDLLYSALVGSANNAVESLVRVSGMSRDKFITRMNEIVKEWGTVNTKFVEPTGLSEQNVSSAKDYAIITKEVMKGVEAEISALPKYEFTTLNTKKKHTIKNTNWLVRNQEYEIIGSKTGYLVESKHCLMNVVKINDKKYFMVTLGAVNKNDSFADMNDLIKFVYKKQV